MQLKMLDPLNVNEVKKILQTENEFISNIFSKMPISMFNSDYTDEDEDMLIQNNSKGKTLKSVGKAKRAQTFTELHARLDELKGTKKLNYKDKLLKKNIKNKIKKKTKKEERILGKKAAQTEKNAAGLYKIKSEDQDEVPKVPKPKPVFNSEGKMVFSKFDFSEIGAKKKLPKYENDPKKMLQIIEQKKEKLKLLEESGQKDKAEEMKEKEAWKTALARASGEKIKDDPSLLKRTIQRQEQKKRHSSKKWDSRLESVQKSKQEKQEKRQDNIMKRKKDKKVNKLKRASKKGRVIPGF